MQLVEHYLREAGNFENIRSLDRSPRRMFSDPLNLPGSAGGSNL